MAFLGGLGLLANLAQGYQQQQQQNQQMQQRALAQQLDRMKLAEILKQQQGSSAFGGALRALVSGGTGSAPAGPGGPGGPTPDVSSLAPLAGIPAANPPTGAPSPMASAYTPALSGIPTSMSPQQAAAVGPLVDQYESGGRNIRNQQGPGGTPASSASGIDQELASIWREDAPKAGVNVNLYPEAIRAPRQIQQQVRDWQLQHKGLTPWAGNKRLLAAAGVGAPTQLHPAEAPQTNPPPPPPPGGYDIASLVRSIVRVNPDIDDETLYYAVNDAADLMSKNTQQLWERYYQTRELQLAGDRLGEEKRYHDLMLNERPGTIVQQGDKTYRIGPPGTSPEEIQFPGQGPVTHLAGGGSNAPADPKVVDYAAQMISQYRMAPISGWALRSPYGQQVMAKVAQLNPEYDATKYTAKTRGEVAFTTGRQADSVRSFSVAISHLDVMAEAADALANGDVQLLNRLQNRTKSEFGYEGPIDFNFVKSIVGDEVSKAVIGGVGSLSDRQQLQAGFDAANSPEQLAGVAHRAKQLMAGQLAGYRRQAGTAGFSAKDFESALSPEAKAALEQPGLPGVDAGTTTPTITTKAEYDALKPGDPFIWNGKAGTKP